MTEAFDPAQLQATLQMCARSLDVKGATLVQRARATLVPSSDERLGVEEADNVLARLRDTERLVIGEEIGQGGMGVVNTATQVALGRVVAVKRLRDGSRGAKNERALVAEAVVAGSLEHPNVIPIYELSTDTSGSPVIVMKRIEGVPWSQLLAHPEDVRARNKSEPMVFHLGVLVEVCNAVHFAHSRQVIHRDLKPDNILIGHFGEVYLADWGIATAPGVRNHVSGTPAYMAPEMLLCAEISSRTDVYLLGSVLHEIVCGRPPHEGATTEALLASILVSEPKVPGYVPEELADLIRACMARDHEARPASALEVRQRIELFLEHRGSTALAAQADLLRAQINPAIARGDSRTAIYELFTQCRFAYREALRSWSGNHHASAGLQQVLRSMLKHEIGLGDLAAVNLLRAEVTDMPPELATAIGELEQRSRAEAQRIERLTRLEHELDPRAGRRARLAVGLGVGLVWTVVPLVGGWVKMRFGVLELLVTLPATLLVLAALAVTGRLTGWRASQLNRRLGLTFGFILLVQALSVSVLYGLHVQGHAVTRGLFFYWFVALGITAASTELRLFSAAIGYLVGFMIVWEWPATRYLCGSVVNLLLMVTMATVWLRQGKQPG